MRLWRRQIIGCLALMVGGFTCGLTVGQDESPASLSGFESNQLYSVQDDIQVDPADSVLTQLAFRTKAVSAESLQRYSRYSADVSDQQLLDDPQKHRFWVFRRRAVVTRIAHQNLPETLATQEFKDFWLLIAEDGDQTYAIISRTIPSAWRKLSSLAEPIAFTGFFFGVKTISPFVDKGTRVPLFVCDRVGWYPDREQEDVGLGESQIYLASQGVDLGYLDTVRTNQKRRMLPEESAYFYQMIAASIEAQKDAPDWNQKPAQFLDLIQEPNRHLGGVVEIAGNVRRIVEVPVTSESLRKELGIDHFYELDMYVPLADVASIRATDIEGNEIVYKDRFPVTVHVPFLPEPKSEYRHNRVKIKGFFYRLWNYQSEFAKRTQQRGQMSPLIIGFEPQIQRSSTATLDMILTVAAIVFVAGVLALIVYLRWGDRNSQSRLRKTHELPDQVEIPGP